MLEPWVIFAAWWVVGLVFFRVPAGIKAEPDAEEHVLARLRARVQ